MSLDLCLLCHPHRHLHSTGQGGCSSLGHSFTERPVGKRNVSEGHQLDVAISLLLTSHWPELGHMPRLAARELGNVVFSGAPVYSAKKCTHSGRREWILRKLPQNA